MMNVKLSPCVYQLKAKISALVVLQAMTGVSFVSQASINSEMYIVKIRASTTTASQDVVFAYPLEVTKCITLTLTDIITENLS